MTIVVSVITETDTNDRLVVTYAPAHTRISSALYDGATQGLCAGDVSAGEGMFVIHAENGTFRYALDNYDPTDDCWTAHRI